MQDTSRSLPEVGQHSDSVAQLRTLFVFEVSSRLLALPLDAIERITPMAALATPPGLPSNLEGVLDLAGDAIPVLRLDKLLQLPPQRLGLYSALAVVKGVGRSRVALVVDRSNGTLSVPEDSVLPLEERDTLNGCFQATVRIQDQTAHLLAPSRILLEQEKDALGEFQRLAQSRLAAWSTF